jgi:hypothetical protein|nr:MAG TPA: Membrane-anchored ion channel, Abi component [Caudoviricetes sp.]
MIDVDFIYSNLDKLFTISFTMLAFVIAAITILQTISTGRIAEFRETGLINSVIKRYNSSICWNFISGVVICLLWFIRPNFMGDIAKIVICVISFLLFLIAIFKTYDAYRFLIYFVKKQ